MGLKRIFKLCITFIFQLCVYVFVCGCVHVSAVHAEIKRGHQMARAGVVGSCESPSLGAGTELGSSTEVVCDLNL